MRDELGVGQHHQGGDDPDDRQRQPHVDLHPRARPRVEDHPEEIYLLTKNICHYQQKHLPEPLDADGHQRQHDHVTGQVLQHRQQVAHYLTFTTID